MLPTWMWVLASVLLGGLVIGIWFGVRLFALCDRAFEAERTLADGPPPSYRDRVRDGRVLSTEESRQLLAGIGL